MDEVGVWRSGEEIVGEEIRDGVDGVAGDDGEAMWLIIRESVRELSMFVRIVGIGEVCGTGLSAGESCKIRSIAGLSLLVYERRKSSRLSRSSIAGGSEGCRSLLSDIGPTTAQYCRGVSHRSRRFVG